MSRDKSVYPIYLPYWTVSLGHCWVPSTGWAQRRCSGEEMISGPQEVGTLLIPTLWNDGGEGVAGTYPAPAHHGSEPIFHHIEVACVGGTVKIWRKGRHAVSETIPVKIKEERMLLEITCSIPAQPRLRRTQESLDKVSSLLRNPCVSQR